MCTCEPSLYGCACVEPGHHFKYSEQWFWKGKHGLRAPGLELCDSTETTAKSALIFSPIGLFQSILPPHPSNQFVQGVYTSAVLHISRDPACPGKRLQPHKLGAEGTENIGVCAWYSLKWAGTMKPTIQVDFHSPGHNQSNLQDDARK